MIATISLSSIDSLTYYFSRAEEKKKKKSLPEATSFIKQRNDSGCVLLLPDRIGQNEEVEKTFCMCKRAQRMNLPSPPPLVHDSTGVLSHVAQHAKGRETQFFAQDHCKPSPCSLLRHSWRSGKGQRLS